MPHMTTKPSMPHPANKPTPKAGILDIAPYVGGKSKAKPGVKVVKLSSNETPLGASPLAVKAYTDGATTLHRYPDGNAALLREAIAEVYKIPVERIVCGAGSDELIAFLIHAYAGPGDEVLYSEYGFLMYKIYAQGAGATPVTAPEKNLRTDVDAILAKVTPRTKIVFIANPNNPTGSYITKTEMKRLHDGLPAHVILAIDGAYSEYALPSPSPLVGEGRGGGALSMNSGLNALNDPPLPRNKCGASSNPPPQGGREIVTDYSDGSELVESSENTIMLRTFSKIYGLSALRLGWAYGPEAIIDVINRIRGPFNVSAPAIAAGAAAVRDVAFSEKTRAFNTKWRDWLAAELTKLGLKVHPSIANFLLIEFPEGKHNAANANSYLMDRGYIPRETANYGLGNCLRITIGLEEDNKAVASILGEFLGS